MFQLLEKWGGGAHFPSTSVAGAKMPKYKISYHHKDSEEIVFASKNVVDGEWLVFFDGNGLVSRKRAQDIESVERVDN